MTILYKISLILTAACALSVKAGSNENKASFELINGIAKNFHVSEVILDSKKLQVQIIESSGKNENFSDYNLPEVYAILTSNKLDNKSLNIASSLINKKTDNVIEPLVYNPTYTPGCTELQINQAYWYRPNQGAQGCFYFAVPKDARAEFFALQQTNTRQVDILANHDINANYSLSYVGETSSTGADDNLRFWAEAGHYYMFLNDIASDDGLILIGAAINEVTYHQESNGSTPSYVGNDTPASATIIQNGFAPLLQETIDSLLDIDYFRMHSFWGQDLSFQVHATNGGVGTSADLILEAFLNGQWIELAIGDLHTASGLPVYAEVLLRVRPQIGAPNGHLRYVLIAGSRPAAIEDLTPDGDIGPKIPPSYSPWERVQNEDIFSWSAKITDTTGNPVRGLYMGFIAENGSWLNTVSFDYGRETNYQGIVAGSGTVSDCGGYMEHSYFNVRYNVGSYRIWAPFFEDYGLATISGSFLHICDDY